LFRIRARVDGGFLTLTKGAEGTPERIFILEAICSASLLLL
jgi:hypothetical protein